MVLLFMVSYSTPVVIILNMDGKVEGEQNYII